ncbi:MAG: hypothetical protein H7257_12800 [Taibaiella sp.]|nr:hypothetical protein [Taibaiella sp.]
MKNALLFIIVATITICSCDVVEMKNCIKIHNNTDLNMLTFVSRHYFDTFLTHDDIIECQNIKEHIAYSDGGILNANDSNTMCTLGRDYSDFTYWKEQVSRDTLIVYFFDLDKIKSGATHVNSKIKIMYITYADFVRNHGVFYFDTAISYLHTVLGCIAPSAMATATR